MRSNDSDMTPWHALIMIGVIISLADLVWWNDLWLTDVEIKECMYQIYVEKNCRGAVFFNEPQEPHKILSHFGSLGKNAESSSPIPCNRRIVISENHGTFQVLKMPGADLIAAGRKIDLNLADVDDLQAIKGIGPGIANKIIDYRNSVGRFSSLRDLTKISGIGSKKFEKISPHLEIVGLGDCLGTRTNCRPDDGAVE